MNWYDYHMQVSTVDSNDLFLGCICPQMLKVLMTSHILHKNIKRYIVKIWKPNICVMTDIFVLDL